MELIGRGRIGTALERRAAARGLACDGYGRDDDWAPLDDGEGPILVCTRADDLEAVLARTPPRRRADLILTQNGMLRPLIAHHGLQANGRGLLFAAVPRLGDDLRPGGDSAFCGRHAAAVVAFCRAVDLPALLLSEHAFAAVELEKLVWNAAFGLLCDALGGTVGAVLTDPACDPLLDELIRVAAIAFDLEVEPAAVIARLRAYSTSIPTYRGGVKEWRWRNGALLAAAAAAGLATPWHDALVARLPAGVGR